MTTKIRFLVVLVALLGFVGWTGYSQKRGPSRDSWEYKVQGHGTSTGERELNELGAQGWELVSVTDESKTFYLKRKK